MGGGPRPCIPRESRATHGNAPTPTATGNPPHDRAKVTTGDMFKIRNYTNNTIG